MFDDPGVVRSDMVRHEIKEKSDVALGESLTGRGKPLRPTDVFIDNMAAP